MLAEYCRCKILQDLHKIPTMYIYSGTIFGKHSCELCRSFSECMCPISSVSAAATVDEESEERPPKVARWNITSPAASEEAQSEGGTPPPGSTQKKGYGSTTRRSRLAAVNTNTT